MPTVLVTGVNRGLGLEFVKQYSQRGYTVIGTCRNPADAAEASSLAEIADNIHLLPLDVSSAESIQSLAASLAGRALDLVVLNAGVMGKASSKLGELEQADFMHSMCVNTVAPALLIQALVDNLRLGELKTVVALSSVLGSIAGNSDGGLYSYRASKAGLNAVVKSAATDLKSEGITVVAMHPGWVQTDMGGQNATITTPVSVSGMLQVIDGLGLDDSGRFVVYDGGELPW